MKRRPAPEWLAWAAGLALAAPAFGQGQPAAPAAVAVAAPATASTAAAAPAAAPAVATAAPLAPATGSGDAVKDQLTRLPSAADMRPSGPVAISAKHGEIIQGNVLVYTGDVHFNSNTLKIDGDRLEIKQAADKQYDARMIGGPAHMFHAGAEPDNPEVTAHSKTMTYDSRSGMLDLVGEAVVTRGKDEIHGETIRYNVVDRSMDVDGGKGRVNIILQAPPPAAAPPAPANGGAASPAPAPTAPNPAPAAPPASPPAETPKP